MEETSLPEMLKEYLWDCNFDELSLDKYPFYITERILNYGDMTSLRWLLDRIDRKLLAEVVGKSRSLTKKARNYWEIMLHEN